MKRCEGALENAETCYVLVIALWLMATEDESAKGAAVE